MDPRTFAGYYSQLHPFLRSVDKSPDEAVAWAKDPANEDEVLNAIKAHVLALPRRYATKQLANASIRSFFLHNRVTLPPDKTLNIRSTIPPVERQLTIEHVRELVGLAVQPWRSMILVKWQSLADTQGLIDISNRHAGTIVEALRENADICKLTIPGRKRKRNAQGFYTFIGTEALASLREYFDRERGWPKPYDAVWVYSTRKMHGKPVTTRGFEEAWLRLLKRAKLIPMQRTHDPGTRYGFNVHNTRDLTISLLNTVDGLNPLSIQFWAGHEIDPLRYNQFYKVKPRYVEEQYRLAAPYLNILTHPPTSVAEEERALELVKAAKDEIEKLKTAVKMLQDAVKLHVQTPVETQRR